MRFDGYCFALTGRAHKSDGTVCQDSSAAGISGARWQFAAVADGVGSAPRSDIGSRTAIMAVYKAVVSLLRSCSDEDALLSALQRGFANALLEIERLSEQEHLPSSDYDTTLTVCLFDGQTVLLGHVGDGGAISLGKDGIFHLLTEVQKGDAWNEVHPLRFGQQSWIFKKAEGQHSAVLLLTDGLLDYALPSLLFGQNDRIYHRFVNQFFPEALNSDAEQSIKLRSDICALLSSDPFDFLTDDLSAAAVWDTTAVRNPFPERYLDEPDWEALKQERYYKLYPSLKPKDNNSKEGLH